MHWLFRLVTDGFIMLVLRVRIQRGLWRRWVSWELRSILREVLQLDSMLGIRILSKKELKVVNWV